TAPEFEIGNNWLTVRGVRPRSYATRRQQLLLSRRRIAMAHRSALRVALVLPVLLLIGPHLWATQPSGSVLQTLSARGVILTGAQAVGLQFNLPVCGF